MNFTEKLKWKNKFVSDCDERKETLYIVLNSLGSITSRCSVNEPVLHERTAEIEPIKFTGWLITDVKVWLPLHVKN